MLLLPLLNDSFIKQIEYDYQLLDFSIDSHYCIVNLNKSRITVSVFILVDKHKDRICRINFYAMSSDLLLNLISQHYSIGRHISLSHALYLGKEIHKAELSIMFKQRYVQS